MAFNVVLVLVLVYQDYEQENILTKYVMEWWLYNQEDIFPILI